MEDVLDVVRVLVAVEENFAALDGTDLEAGVLEDDD